MSNVSPGPSATGLKFWFVELAPGVLPRNFGTLLYSAFTTIGLLAFVSIGTPYVLNVYLKIPLDRAGPDCRRSGRLERDCAAARLRSLWRAC